MIALCNTNLLCTPKATVLITSLPTVIKDLDMGGNYIWVNNVSISINVCDRLYGATPMSY